MFPGVEKGKGQFPLCLKGVNRAPEGMQGIICNARGIRGCGGGGVREKGAGLVGQILLGRIRLISRFRR